MVDLHIVWFVLIGILFCGYAILDGFDLGVGALHLFVKTDDERRIFLNAIGPVWDGNEVWLVTAGGALFAAFPEVYATVFSGFYIAVMLLLVSLIFRAVAIEFRSKREERWWRQMWDVSFSLSSIFSSLLMGIALGNIIWGIGLDAQHEYTGSFMDLLNPYALLMGLTTLSLFMMHGSIYIVLKTEGPLHDKVRVWIKNTIISFVICYAVMTMVTLVYLPRMAQPFRHYPILFIIPLMTMLAIANIPREIHQAKDMKAFFSSCFTMVGLMALIGIGQFPYMVTARPDLQYSLTIFNAASSQKTLLIMFIISLIGIPLVLSYTVSIYYIFRGKVKLDAMSY